MLSVIQLCIGLTHKSHTHTCTRTRTYTCTRTHTSHTHACTHTHTHTHTHVPTHIPPPPPPPPPPPTHTHTHASYSELSIAGSSLLDSDSLLDELDLHSPAPVLRVHSTPSIQSENPKVKVSCPITVTRNGACTFNKEKGWHTAGCCPPPIFQQDVGACVTGQRDDVSVTGGGEQSLGQLDSGQEGSGQQFGTQKSKIIKLNQTPSKHLDY